MDLGIKDRVAVVTGGSRGLGRAIARALAREGARVALTYRESRGAAESVADAIRDAGGDALAVPLDLAAPEAVVRAAAARWGRVDILVNVATARDLHAAYAAIQAVVPLMRDRGFGRIVSVTGPDGDDAQLAATAGAIQGLTRTLAKELGPAGILVNVFAPGLTLTERTVETVAQSVRDKAAQASPIRRLLSAEELAPAIVFLCSAANSAITGEHVRAG